MLDALRMPARVSGKSAARAMTRSYGFISTWPSSTVGHVVSKGGAEGEAGAHTPAGPTAPEAVVGDGTMSVGEGGGPPLRGSPDQRPPAPLQYRDPERYRIIGEHGRGGLGRVYRARDLELGRDVALKELLNRGNGSEFRFFREALITARLEHPGIVPVHEAGCWPDGTPFYAMKLVSGRPLADLLESATTLEDRLRLIPHVLAVADAIAYAHDHGIIHRDLKPSNVIIGDFGEAVVIDWGLAKDLGASTADVPAAEPHRSPAASLELTVAGSILGTPAYMAPEQAAGADVDARADVYAIGMILYHVCTGSVARPAEPTTSIAQKLRHIDPDLIAIVCKALSAERSGRYPEAGALAVDLNAFLSGARIGARSYSLVGLLRHWVRRHKSVSIAALAATVIAAVAAGLSMSEIVDQRDRVNRALQQAETERDRARLSEATALLEKDPTRARSLLDSIDVRGPQHAWLLSRAAQDSARHVLRIDGRVGNLLLEPTTSAVALLSKAGELYSLDTAAGTTRLLDRDLTGPLTRAEKGWLYARASFGAPTVTVASTTGGPATALAAGQLLSQPTSTLLWSVLGIRALEPSGDLYGIKGDGPVLLGRGLRSIAADGRLFMSCTLDGRLEVRRDGRPILQTRCGQNPSGHPMAAAGDHYAALLDEDTFLLVRGDQSLRIPIRISGEYEVALSANGLFAVADYNDRTWLVRADRDRAELGPVHTSQPTTAAAQGRFAGWGYADGAIVVLDTSTDKTWRFRGHSERVEYMAIDERYARVVSAGGDEVRIWDLRPRSWETSADFMGPIRCEVFNMAMSRTGTFAGLDCNDGSVRVWSRTSRTLRQVHRHDALAFGVAWLRDSVCSGAWDGRVLCSAADGSSSREVLAGDGRIRWLAGSPDHELIAIATDSGTIYKYDGELQRLYSHGAVPYRVAISGEGRWLASGAFDGSLILYDLVLGRVTSRQIAHSGQVTAVVWAGGNLWTSGADGALKRWEYGDGELRPRRVAQESKPLKFLHVFRGGWTAAADDATALLIADERAAARRFRIDLGRPILGVDVSPDERFVAAASIGEVILVDRRRQTLARLLTDQDTPAFAGFADSRSLVVGTPTSLRLVRIDATDQIRFTVAEERTDS